MDIRLLDPRGKRVIAFIAILLLGILLRCWCLDTLPGKGAINQDEAFSAYEAWSLLNEGVDSDGYPFPVYFLAWGSGMNALQTYCTIPFIALLGLNNLAIRLPQVLLSILSLIVFYFFCRETGGEKRALIGMLVLAVMPWHIMISRWALESNFLPGMLLLAETCVLLAVRRPWMAVPASALFPLSLYAYSAAWIVLPPLLLLSFVWLIRRNHAVLRCLPAAIAVMVVLAAPIVLFALVNYGFMPEIVTPHFSIPKLSHFRSGDVSIAPADMLNHLLAGLRILVYQRDDTLWNACEPFGLYYHITVPFALYGGFCAVRDVRSKRKASMEGLILIWLGCGLVLMTLIDSNINRLNLLHMPVIYLTAVGLTNCFERFADRCFNLAVSAALMVCLALFCHAYVTDYNEQFANRFYLGLEDAMSAVKGADQVVISNEIPFPEILLYDRMPSSRFVEDRAFQDDGALFRKLQSCGRFSFANEAEDAGAYADTCDAMICLDYDADRYRDILGDRPFTRTDYDTVIVFTRDKD